jgi:hypothetical protein
MVDETLHLIAQRVRRGSDGVSFRWGLTLKTRMVTAFLVCCTAVGFAQNNTAAESQTPAARPPTVHLSAAVMAGLVDHKALP